MCLQCSGVEPEDVERLSDCAEMLSQVATHHLTMPAEIPRVIDLLQDMVASLSQEEAHPPSFNISQVDENSSLSLYVL